MSVFPVFPILQVELIIVAGAGYLVGSIMTAPLVCRLLGLPDPRTYGSHNPGATNVARRNVLAGGLTVIGDASKAAIPMFVLHASGFGDNAVVLCGFAAFIGHVFPLSLRKERKGGKGVATFLGFLLVANHVACLLFVVSWLFVFAVTRYSAAAGMTASALAPVFVWMHAGAQVGAMGEPSAPHGLYTAITAGMAVLILWRHRHDLTRARP